MKTRINYPGSYSGVRTRQVIPTPPDEPLPGFRPLSEEEFKPPAPDAATEILEEKPRKRVRAI
jgi:hypothetical protein